MTLWKIRKLSLIELEADWGNLIGFYLPKISETFNETHATSQMIDCIQLSDFMTMHQIEWIDLLKIDAEGSEKSIFQNAELWIDKVTVISVELHDRIVEGCTAAFNDATQNFSRFEQQGEKVTAYK